MRARDLGVLLAATAASACSLTTDFSNISGGTAGSGGSSPTHATPPARPTGDPTPMGAGTKSLWLGVKHLHFAHSNDALKVPGAWQDWGYDLDGLCTGGLASEQAGTCIRPAGASADSVADGKLCRDNAFGSQIVPQLNVYAPTFENDTNDGLTGGTSAWILVLEDLADGTDDPYVPAKLYLAEALPDHQKPAWDGTDQRRVLPMSVSGGLDAPLVTFPNGYLRDNVWVSGEPSTVDVYLPLGKTGVLLPLHAVSAVMAFRLNDAHVTVVDGTGQFAGAIPASSLETMLAPFVKTQTLFCPGTPQYDAFFSKVQTSPDVVVGAATLQDPAATCDGVSFGIGINLAPVAQPVELGTDPDPTTPCDAAPGQ